MIRRAASARAEARPDRYISRLYLHAKLSFLSLLGLFYISTFIDRSDKVFKNQASVATIGQLLIWMTPQFVYYVIPIAALLSVLVTYGMLSRTSELTVMKACGSACIDRRCRSSSCRCASAPSCSCSSSA